MKNKACLVCGGTVEYYPEKREKVCMLCGETVLTNACCENGHYICDSCHSGKALEGIVSRCREETSGNPIAILDRLMKNPAIHMHGPEHHVLAGAALLTAYKNCTGDPALQLREALTELMLRGSAIPGGSCGFLGLCGAAASAGAFISIIAKATPLSTDAWKMCGQAASWIISRIAEPGGPRCCKRVSYLAVIGASEYLKQKFDVTLKMPERIVCEFYPHNRECIGTRCPFFPRDRKVGRIRI